jgi:hypothetical protein
MQQTVDFYTVLLNQLIKELKDKKFTFLTLTNVNNIFNFGKYESTSLTPVLELKDIEDEDVYFLYISYINQIENIPNKQPYKDIFDFKNCFMYQVYLKQYEKWLNKMYNKWLSNLHNNHFNLLLLLNKADLSYIKETDNVNLTISNGLYVNLLALRLKQQIHSHSFKGIGDSKYMYEFFKLNNIDIQ